MSVNKVILIGRLGKDPEVRYMTNGEAVATVSLATTENWKDQNGKKQSKTEWHNLVFYRRLAEIVGEHLKKGALIYVESKIQTRKYQNKEGQDRYITEIIVNELKMLGSKQDQPTDSSDAAASQPAPAKAPATAAKSSFDNFDDDIPF